MKGEIHVIEDALLDHLVAETRADAVIRHDAVFFDAGPMMMGVRFTALLDWRHDRRVQGWHQWEATLLKEYANETAFVGTLATGLHEWAQAERLAADRAREADESGLRTEGDSGSAPVIRVGVGQRAPGTDGQRHLEAAPL